MSLALALGPARFHRTTEPSENSLNSHSYTKFTHTHTHTHTHTRVHKEAMVEELRVEL